MKNKLIYVMALVLGLILISCGKGGGYVVSGFDEAETSENSEEKIEEADYHVSDKETAVYVCGAVVNPGVYRFDVEVIKEEAVAAAGGFAKGASREYVNLAEHITDGEKIYVPYESELEVSLAYGEDENSGTEYSGVYSSDGRLNINKASKEDFMTLTGIGEAKAEAIVSYREEHGAFNSIDEIMNVNGIKSGVYNNIKDYITLN
ncbi:MAG: helix-hairpin-helix domain-containing protein [Lachnospiraceae bacterium]|nr:helix-hairpin-helix domain-containing protein [Lachnospiraceae bacterium]MBR1817202.1 helix-hairpin-helix domain-containing protein [Lachnospiraceae bacterium]